MRLAIAIPCHVFIAPQMAQSLCAMCTRLGASGIDFALRFLGNAVSTFGRNELVRWAKAVGADYVLWIDTDMTFPPDAAQRLIRSGVPFVGANYARKHEARDSVSSGLDGQRMTPKPDGWEPASVIGFGFTLTRMEVLDAVAEPWFVAVEKDPDGPCDEVRFCERAAKAGFQPHVDHALSRQVGHVGLHEYRLSFTSSAVPAGAA